jgi:hypothetical protein
MAPFLKPKPIQRIGAKSTLRIEIKPIRLHRQARCRLPRNIQKMSMNKQLALLGMVVKRRLWIDELKREYVLT